MVHLNLKALLAELESLRGNPVIVYVGMIQDDAMRMLYECLQKLGRTDQLDLVLSTSGGVVNVARRIALLLHEYTLHLNILVPYRAKSAGTLLCLAANRLVLNPLAELTPIDGHIGVIGENPPDSPPLISAEDVRAFRDIAEEWFGVQRDEDRLQVFALLSQRVFPTSLSSFYRADRLIRQSAEELLHYQLPDVEAVDRQKIINQLVSGYYSHDYSITRTEARQLGLQVDFPDPAEEKLLWNIQEKCRQIVGEQRGQPDQVTGLIASTNFMAQQVNRRLDMLTGESRGKESPPREVMDVRWEILAED
jgi:hypothetical protein